MSFSKKRIAQGALWPHLPPQALKHCRVGHAESSLPLPLDLTVPLHLYTLFAITSILDDSSALDYIHLHDLCTQASTLSVKGVS